METSTTIKNLQFLLKLVYGLVPIVAGLDHYTNLLVQWDSYLASWMVDLLPMSGAAFMKIAGSIEIVAGILVLYKPKFGAPLVSAWLVLIALTLISSGKYFDVAVRDIVMAVGAYVLWKLTLVIEDNEK